MFHPKATTYEPMEKKPKDKKFKQNAYEEIRKIVDNEGSNTVNEIKTKHNDSKKENIKFKLNLFD